MPQVSILHKMMSNNLLLIRYCIAPNGMPASIHFIILNSSQYRGYLAHVLLKHLSAITELMNRLAGFVCEKGGERMVKRKRKKRNVLILLVNLSSYLALTGQNASMHVHICFTQIAACPFQTC